MKYTSKSDIGRRSNNEDASRVPQCAEDIPFIAVADGMGGHAGGEVASRMVITGMLEELHPLRLDELSHQLSAAIMNVNLDVFRAAKDDPALSGMGSTLICAVLQLDSFLCANVGNSRLYLFDGETLRQISRDHSFVQMLVDSGDITPAEARTHPRRNLIMRAMGIDTHVTVDLFDVQWKAGDMLLLCSDGLSGPVADAEIEALLRQDEPLDTICALLVQRALDNGGQDNITVVLAQNDGGAAE